MEILMGLDKGIINIIKIIIKVNIINIIITHTATFCPPILTLVIQIHLKINHHHLLIKIRMKSHK